jgi:zinc/manganese transport system permease protein
MLEIMLLPLLACLILVGIHVYLGIHVIERGVIFVDIALAQIAALGSIVGFLAGIPFHTIGSFLFSLAFTLVGASIFSFTRFKEKDIPQEAIIGIVYAVVASLSIVLLNFAPSEADQIKYMLVGNILFVSLPDIIKIAILYALVGIFHFIFRKKFMQVSTDPGQAKKDGLNIRLWDFLFYASFGLVVTSSVEIVGVLLVFSFLIVPSVAAVILTKRLGLRLILGWSFGIITSLAGLYLSFTYDFPTGAIIVVCFGALIILVGIASLFIKKKSPAISGNGLIK